jgi:hypothetical protein
MGLDISAYKNIRPAVPSDSASVRLYSNENFPIQSENLIPGLVGFEEKISVRVGSYHTFSAFREDLCRAALNMSIYDLWKNPSPHLSRPFERLLNFSDCSGWMDNITCARLYGDFEQYHDRAEWAAGLGMLDLEVYDKFLQAFAFASQGGCLEFH